MLRRESLSWAAGFFDGEGYVGNQTTGGKNKVRLEITQVSREPLDRFAAVMGVGRVYGPYRKKTPLNPKRSDRPDASPQWMFVVYRFEHVQACMASMWEFLSGPKRRQFAKVMRTWHDGRRQAAQNPEVHDEEGTSVLDSQGPV